MDKLKHTHECTLMSEEHKCNGRSVFYYETPSLDIYNYETSPFRLVDARVEVLHFPLKVTGNVIPTPNILFLNKKNKTKQQFMPPNLTPN